jgi:hypothetical protein
MNSAQNTNISLAELLKAADKYYPESYLSSFFDPATGALRSGSGDSLAKFIVRELRENFDEESSRSQQVTEAIRVLERARRDIQGAIAGIRDLGNQPERC